MITETKETKETNEINQQVFNLPKAVYSSIKEFKKNIKYNLLTSRFNNKTYDENKEYVKSPVCKKSKIECIYCSPKEISKEIKKEEILFVLEMNNNNNKIMGIGMIKNHSYSKFCVYENNNYNRYNYIGKHHLNREEIIKYPEGEIIIKFLDKYCFTGNKHLKRGTGLTLFPTELLYRCSSLILITDVIKEIFKKKYIM